MVFVLIAEDSAGVRASVRGNANSRRHGTREKAVAITIRKSGWTRAGPIRDAGTAVKTSAIVRGKFEKNKLRLEINRKRKFRPEERTSRSRRGPSRAPGRVSVRFIFLKFWRERLVFLFLKISFLRFRIFRLFCFCSFFFFYSPMLVTPCGERKAVYASLFLGDLARRLLLQRPWYLWSADQLVALVYTPRAPKRAGGRVWWGRPGGSLGSADRRR